jgi:hypothetical protein
MLVTSPNADREFVALMTGALTGAVRAWAETTMRELCSKMIVFLDEDVQRGAHPAGGTHAVPVAVFFTGAGVTQPQMAHFLAVVVAALRDRGAKVALAVCDKASLSLAERDPQREDAMPTTIMRVASEAKHQADAVPAERLRKRLRALQQEAADAEPAPPQAAAAAADAPAVDADGDVVLEHAPAAADAAPPAAVPAAAPPPIADPTEDLDVEMKAESPAGKEAKEDAGEPGEGDQAAEAEAPKAPKRTKKKSSKGKTKSSSKSKSKDKEKPKAKRKAEQKAEKSEAEVAAEKKKKAEEEAKLREQIGRLVFWRLLREYKHKGKDFTRSAHVPDLPTFDEWLPLFISLCSNHNIKTGRQNLSKGWRDSAPALQQEYYRALYALHQRSPQLLPSEILHGKFEQSVDYAKHVFKKEISDKLREMGEHATAELAEVLRGYWEAIDLGGLSQQDRNDRMLRLLRFYDAPTTTTTSATRTSSILPGPTSRAYPGRRWPGSSSPPPPSSLCKSTSLSFTPGSSRPT